MFSQSIKQALRRVEKFLLSYKHTRDVLLVVHNEVMMCEAELIDEVLAGCRQLRLWYCFVTPERFTSLQGVFAERRLRHVPYRWARWVRWDLILYPDHGPSFRRECPKILTGHGLNTGKMVNDEHYFFGHKSLDRQHRLIYQKIFRTSLFLKEMARKFYPDFVAAVRVTGSLQADRLLAIDPDIPDVLKLRGLDPGKQTVLIASSWGEHSLIQSSAEWLLAQMKELARDYNIILTIHLNNYHAPLSGGKDWERELAALAGSGVYVTRPTENPYVLLHVADLMVTDMTSLGLYFTLFTRPIIFLDDPRIEYTPDALIPELKNSCYVTNDIADLSDKIRECLVAFKPEKIRTLNDKVFSYRGSSRQRCREEILESLGLS
jgi:hypothetical protein